MLTIHCTGELKDEAMVEIYSVQGQKVSGLVLPAGTTSQQINITELPCGIYLMKSVIGDTIVLKKFSVIR